MIQLKMGKRHEKTFFQRRPTNGRQPHKKMHNITDHQGNANQNYNQISTHTCQNGSSQQHKKQQVLARMWRKGNPLVLLVGKQTSAATLENSMEFPQKVKNTTQLYHYWVFIPKKMKKLIWKYICAVMFIVALFTIARIWKQRKCPSIDEWIKKKWCIYTQWIINQP